MLVGMRLETLPEEVAAAVLLQSGVLEVQVLVELAARLRLFKVLLGETALGGVELRLLLVLGKMQSMVEGLVGRGIPIMVLEMGEVLFTVVAVVVGAEGELAVGVPLVEVENGVVILLVVVGR